MSGHSKWATIKRKKGATDAKRGRLFSKLVKEITIAAKMGGGDPGANPRLRLAMENAKANSMPMDNVNRAIKKGTGELEGVNYEEITYEAYGPGGFALMVEVLTDNKNRTVAEIRHLLSKHGGNLGETGSVGWIFSKSGLINISTEKSDEETVMEVCLDAGAEDIKTEGDEIQVSCAPEDLSIVKEALDAAKIECINSEITMVPQNLVKLEERDAEKALKLMDILEDHDDVQNVFANFDISEEILEKIAQ